MPIHFKRPAKGQSTIDYFFSKVQKTDSCWIWIGLCSGNYGEVHLLNERMAHRVSWVICNGPIPKGMCVLHNCPGGDNPKCVNPAHLWLGDRIANNKDRHNKGRDASGDRNGARTRPETRARGSNSASGKYPGLRSGIKNGNAKLSELKVQQIRAIHACGISQNALAREFNINLSVVWQIVHYTLWKHVHDKPLDLEGRAILNRLLLTRRKTTCQKH